MCAMTSEKFTVSGSQLVDKIKQLIHEGNIRRVRIIRARPYWKFRYQSVPPAAAIGIMVAPILAAVGAFAALVTECTIEVERIEDP